MLLALILLQLAPAALGDNWERPVLRETVPQVLPADRYAVVVHTQPKFEGNQTAIEGGHRLIQMARANQVPSLSVVDSYELRFSSNTEGPSMGIDTRYLWLDQADQILESRGGAHRLSFPNAREIYVGGGMLTWCLCEFLRDVMRDARPGRASPLRIILVADAIYDPWEFNVDGEFLNMRQFLDRRGKQALASVFNTFVLGPGHTSTICYRQNTGTGALLRSELNLRLFIGSEEIFRTHFTSASPSVDLVVVRAEELEEIMHQQSARPPVPASNEAQESAR
jgi:hypothetical protein